jgi:zinc protease
VQETRDKAQAILMVGYRASDMFSSDRAALELIDEASSDLGSRFFCGFASSSASRTFVGTSHMAGSRPVPFVFYLGTDPLKLNAVKAELLEEIRLLAENGLTETELARAKEKYLGQQEIRQQSNDSFAFNAALDELTASALTTTKTCAGDRRDYAGAGACGGEEVLRRAAIRGGRSSAGEGSCVMGEW